MDFSDVFRIFGVTGLPQALKQGIEYLLARGFRRGLRRQGFLELLGLRTGFLRCTVCGRRHTRLASGLAPVAAQIVFTQTLSGFFLSGRGPEPVEIEPRKRIWQ